MLNDLPGHGLRIAVEHAAVIGIEQGILHPGIPRPLAALDDDDVLRHVGVQNRHAVDRAGLVGAGTRIDHVVGPDDQGDVGLGEFTVDLFEVHDLVVRHPGFRQQDVHVPRHAAGHRVDGELHLDPGFLEDRGHFPHLVLGMGHGHAVTRDDDDLRGVTHHRRRIETGEFLHAAADRFARTTGHHRGEQDVGDRPVHGLGHQLGEQRTSRTDDDAGNNQCRVAQDVAFETDGQARKSIEQRDDHRHVGPADGQGDDQTEHERDGEEGEDQFGLGRGEDDHGATEADGDQGEQDIDRILRRQAMGFLEHALQLGPGDAGAGEGHRADQRTDDGEDRGGEAVGIALGELDGGNGGGGTAAQPHDNRQPWLAFTYAIACNGIFPVPE